MFSPFLRSFHSIKTSAANAGTFLRQSAVRRVLTAIALPGAFLCGTAAESFAAPVDFSGVNISAISSSAGQNFPYTIAAGGSTGVVNVRLISGACSVQPGSSPDGTGFYALQSGDLTPAVLRFTFDAPRSFKIVENETIASFEKNSFTLPSGQWTVLSSSNVTKGGGGPVISFEGSTPNGGTPYGDFAIEGSGMTFDFQITNSPAVPVYGSAISLDVGAAPPGPQNYDAVRDFHHLENPGAGIWKYGYTEVDGSGFNLFTERTAGDSRFAWARSASEMGIVLNASGADLHYNIYTIQQPDVLGLFPGNDGRKAVVRWTAPVGGIYTIDARFQDIDTTTSDVAIILNEDVGAPLFRAFINDATTDGTAVVKPFSFQVAVNAGDTIDFRVGWGNNGQYSYDGTGLSAKITPDGGGGANALSPTSLTINGSTSPFSVTPGGPIHLDAGQSSHANGLVVRAQFSATPDVESSWADLADGRSGALKPATAADHYATDTTFYPAGTAISFRAVSSAPGLADSISNVVGPFELKQAQLSIGESIKSTSDPLGHVARAGDKLEVTLTFANNGNAPAKSLKVATLVPKYIPAADTNRIQRQFAETDFDNISPGGQIVNVSTLVGTNTQWVLPGGDVITPVDAQGNPNKAIVWNIGDLNSGFSQFVRYTINVSNSILVPSSITQNNVYTVSSTTNQPPLAADEHTSQSANLGVDIRGPIVMTATTAATTVAPGGYITYTLKLDNLSGTSAPNAAAVFTVPSYTRFAGFGLDKKGRPIPDPAGNVRGVLVKHSGSPDQLLIYVGKVAAHKSATVNVTVQTQWIQPADVLDQKIATVDYAAAFLNGDAIRDFLKAFSNPGSVNFIDFLKEPTHSVAATFNDSGVVKVTLAGSTEKEPKLALFKAIVDDDATPLDDIETEDQGNGDLLNTVAPGKEISFAVVAINNGDSPAEDVYVRDRLPEGTVLTTGGKNPKPLSSNSSPAQLKAAVSLAYKSGSGQQSKGDYTVSIEPDGRLLIEGLHLEPNDSVGLTFAIQVLASGDSAPAVGQTLYSGASTIGSSSTPHTPPGFPSEIPIKVTGQASFSLNTLAMVPQPATSSNVNATADAMTAIYKKDANALPLVPPTSAGLPAKFIPGAQRFYVHYSNTSGVAASGVTLNFPIPPNTVFYRASAVNKGKLTPLPNGATLQAPPFLASGTARFHFNRLNAGAEGDVMVEVIILSGAVKAGGSLVIADGVEIHDSTVPDIATRAANAPRFFGNHQKRATFTAVPLADANNIPSLGIAKVIPPLVKVGETFEEQVIVFNYGDIACPDPLVDFIVPTGAKALSMTYGSTTIQLADNHPGDVFTWTLASNNGPITQNQTDRLKPHTAGAITVTLRATGAVGTSIVDEGTHLIASFVGRIYPAPTSTNIIDAGVLITDPTARIRAVQGADYVNLGNGAVVIPLGGGNLVASGGGNLVASGGGNLIASGGGNLVASGGGNLINLINVAGIGNTTGAGLLSNLPKLVGGNIFNGPAGNLISQDGGSLISNDGGGLAMKVSALVASELVASGGGNIVASGGGNLVASGGGNLVASGGGNLVASGGGNLITFGGAIVASGGGNLVASGGGNLVASGGGNVAISSQASSALVASGGGNVVVAGGGSIVASGGGN